MSIYALADFHLSFDTPGKSMEAFGPAWENWTEKIQTSCAKTIKNDDLLLIAGDISWANSLEKAKKDLSWIGDLPGCKLLIKGNHDYWWPSSAKLKEALPNSIHFLHNSSFDFKAERGLVSIGGTRLWDSDEYNFSSLMSDESLSIEQKSDFSKLGTSAEDKKIFKRELQRLQLSLDKLNPKSDIRICMTHYPPIGLDLQDSMVSKLLKSYHIDICVFGHLHGIAEGKKNLFGSNNNTRYVLTSSDYLKHKPIKLV